MATTKITITIPDEQLAEIRALVEAKTTPNVSAFVKHAIRIALSDVRDFQAEIREALERTGGPLTDDERAWVDQILLEGARNAPGKEAAA